MKRIFSLLASLLVAAVVLSAQKPTLKYVDAVAFPTLGKVTPNTAYRYSRLPASCEQESRHSIWSLGKHSAGLAIRFRTDATTIALRWTSIGLHKMAHQALTGTRGIDMYIHKDGKWQFVRTGFPDFDNKTSNYTMLENVSGGMHEYMMYLSLYEGVESVEIGVNEDAVVEAPQLQSPQRTRPVIMYGSSILQGGCCSRPGMAYTNILSRWLDREVVNLGFSGNAKLDMDVARLMASVPDPALYYLDNVPNCDAKLIESSTEEFVRILHDAHPDVPIIMVQGTHYCNSVDAKVVERETSCNAAQKKMYEKLRASGIKNLYFIPNDGLIGSDEEATVDDCHLTDLGMMRYAEYVYPYIKKALRKSGK